MIQKTFNEGRRPVKIEIDENSIVFKFPTEGDREFYDIPKLYWIKNVNKYREHMMEKNWFTEDMRQFINEVCVVND